MVTKRARQLGLVLPSKGTRAGWRAPWQLASLLMLLSALTVGLLMLRPPLYLTLRAAGAGQAALVVLLKPTIVSALVRTILLASSVTLASAVIAVPIAWLIVCTDLPHRRFCFVASALPLLRPGLTAGAGLVFLTCMKELPATLILSPLGFHTLAAGVWSNISEAFFAQAAAPALLLVFLSSLPLALLTLREN